MLTVCSNGLRNSKSSFKLITLISETHFINIPYYTIYDTKHPASLVKNYVRFALIIKDNIKYHLHNSYGNLQATTPLGNNLSLVKITMPNTDYWVPKESHEEKKSSSKTTFFLQTN
uniref:Uncharacterized protein n=1 Tax=Vespula pensylvanica TaxID=30213 RepID=A0A834K111_VESPE|nr:hypothetical protein H0235_016733 [Vespula pensylvanica]